MTALKIAVGAFFVIGVSLHIFFMRRLQTRCPEEWEKLGSPNPFLPNDLRTNWRLTKYVMGGAFEGLPQRGVVQLGRVVRVVEWLWVCGWIIGVAVVILAIFGF